MQISTDLKELIEEKKFSDLVKLLISKYKIAESEQERKNVFLDLLKISQNFPDDLAPVLIRKLDKYKFKRFLKEQEKIPDEEIPQELEEELELDDNIYSEILKTLCQVALKEPDKSISLVPILIGELSTQSSYETCEKTIQAIQSSNPDGCIQILAQNMDEYKNKRFKWRFVLQLGKIGTEHPELVDKIITILKDILKKDQDEKVRAAATEAMSLIRIETSDEEAVKQVPVEVLEKVSKDTSELVQDIAKEKLGEIKQVTETEKMISEVKNGLEQEGKTDSKKTNDEENEDDVPLKEKKELKSSKSQKKSRTKPKKK
ncbi:MAG: HEAT repeat domain-containing protein [Candidatus Lokiarchaeota archaeon]|nr:HEAT repeat domain-containing protein [Candidatus Lokiarchaeota archaeon]